jgi:FkbM family methyltransferase
MVLYGFEPVWSLVEMLNKKFKDDPRVHIIPCAVDEQPRFTQFNVAAWRDQGCSSFYDYADGLEKSWSQTNYYQLPTHKQKVQVVRLDDFCKTYGISNIDYLWVDAQGADFAVLKSLGSYIDIVQAGRVEAVLNVSLYKREGNSVSDILPWLESKGFEIESVVPDANPQQCEANIHFKRKPK